MMLQITVYTFALKNKVTTQNQIILKLQKQKTRLQNYYLLRIAKKI